MDNHPTRERLRDWLDGCLSEADSHEIEAHVTTCAEVCPTLLDELANGLRPADLTVSFVAAKSEPMLTPPAAKIGRFEIRRKVGEGGFGVVYEAYDPQLDRDIALKVAKLGGDSDQRYKRFLREAKSAANLRHPHIVPLSEFGQDGDQFYLALAFIRGQSLNHVIRELNAKSEPWFWICQAVAYRGSGNVDGYRKMCVQMAAKFGETKKAREANRLLFTCLSDPEAISYLTRLTELADTAYPNAKGKNRLHAAALYRTGQYDACIRAFTESNKTYTPRAWDYTFMAMAYIRQGKLKEGKENLEKAAKWLEQFDGSGAQWIEWVEAA